MYPELLRVLATSFLVLISFVCAAPKGAPTAANPTVTIASGVLVGTATIVSNQPTATATAGSQYVNSFLGVPFAAPPLNALRFAPPTPHQAWSSARKAQTIPAACLQNFASAVSANERAFFNNPLGPAPVESEDCLYLNIFAPLNASSSNRKPVLFWIFGGNLAFGSSSLSFYNGSSFALNQDVVVVAINYRTNIFGFPGAPELPAGQTNVGFLDQRFALQWVQSNIAKFGGDPTKVTIFGESAGGESVKQLLAQPPSPLPFRAAILESEQSAAMSSVVTYRQVLANFNCADITCLRTVPGLAIQSYIESQNLGFGPVNDDTNTPDVRPSILSGTFAKVPTLIGSNAAEFQIFLALLGVGSGQQALNLVYDSLQINSSAVRSSLLTTLAGAGITDATDVAIRIATDAAFTCPASTLTNFLAANGYNTWRYRYEGIFSNLAVFPGAQATHTLEIPLVWGTYPLDNVLGPATATEIALSRYMQTQWANFAKNPSAGPAWPKIGTNLGVELGVLGNTGAPTGEVTKPLLYADLLCPVLNPVSDAAGLNY